MEIANKSIYTNSIVPAWNLVASEFNANNLTLNKLQFDYSNIEVLQDDKKLQAEKEAAQNQVWINLYNSGIATLEEAREGVGLNN